MQKLPGIAVSPGVAIGEAVVIDTEGFRIPRQFVDRDAVDHELERLASAAAAAGREIEEHRDAITRELGPEYGAIFSAHLQMLRDPRLRSEIEALVRQRHYTPEYATSRALRRYVKVFQSLGNNTLAERASDVIDIEKRLLRHLLGRSREELAHLTSPAIVLTHDLTPSEAANLSRAFVLGFATEIGASGSHTAIVAEGMEIPAVVGVGGFLTDVSGGDTVIIDGDHGLVILQPDEETLARYRQVVEQTRHRAIELTSLRELPAVTTDGVRIELLGNIEFPGEVTHCCERGCDGIGLYRTEFLYLSSTTEPDEEAQYAAYLQVAEAMSGRPVVIRTLDLGADKMMTQPAPSDSERNPFLGLRSIRLSLKNLPLFRTQLRAILRASTAGDVRIMFPLVSTLLEWRQAKMVLTDVMEDLEEQHVPFNRKLLVGMMVEVPAVVMMIDHFVREVDFLSIGTNDLIQYTLAVDRGNKDVAELYNAADPAVLRLIEMALVAGDKAGVPVNVCGQMSGSPIYTMLLLGMGLRRFSVTPSAAPGIKQLIRSVSLERCQAVAARVRALEHARDVKSYLREELKRVAPELAW